VLETQARVADVRPEDWDVLGISLQKVALGMQTSICTDSMKRLQVSPSLTKHILQGFDELPRFPLAKFRFNVE
jgi:hypothetical protein